MGWDGKRRRDEEQTVRVFVCAGCGKLRHRLFGGTLVKMGKFLVHDSPECRQLRWAAERARQEEEVEA